MATKLACRRSRHSDFTLCHVDGLGARAHRGVLDCRIRTVGDGVVEHLKIRRQHRYAIAAEICQRRILDHHAVNGRAAGKNQLPLEILYVYGVDRDIRESTTLPHVDRFVAYVPSVAAGRHRRVLKEIVVGVAIRHSVKTDFGDGDV